MNLSASLGNFKSSLKIKLKEHPFWLHIQGVHLLNDSLLLHPCEYLQNLLGLKLHTARYDMQYIYDIMWGSQITFLCRVTSHTAARVCHHEGSPLEFSRAPNHAVQK